MRKLVIAAITALSLCSAFAQSQRASSAQALNQEMAGLAGKLNKALVAQRYTNVAAVDFTDIQGQPTELGRFLSEQLTVEMVLTEGISMLDRANIKSILAEHKLTQEGLVNPANAKKLGEFAGVDAILLGNATALDDGIVLMVKAISTASAKIVAAGRITFPMTSEIQHLLNRGISSSGNAFPDSPSVAGAGTTYRDANAITTKDIGSLRVVLKSVLPMKIGGESLNGIRCSFDFVNRETQRQIVVALNAAPGDGPVDKWNVYHGPRQTLLPWVATRLGDVLRTTLVDERGATWTLSSPGVTGMSAVSVGRRSRSAVFSPTDVASLLQKQDEIGTNLTRDADNPQGEQFAFIFGSMITIPPGQSIKVTMSFAQNDGGRVSGPPPSFFQMASEIIVGVSTSGTRKSYSLQNLVFDRVGMPGL